MSLPDPTRSAPGGVHARQRPRLKGSTLDVQDRRPVLVIGAGGHAAVVADALLAAGETVLGFLDPDATKHGGIVCCLPVLGSEALLAGHANSGVWLANGIGGVKVAALRGNVQARLEWDGWQFTGVRHPSSTVSPFAEIGPGVQLMAGCVVQAGARIGAGCIVNTAAVIEHDTLLGAFVHVAPGSVLCGQVVVGDHSHIGAAAVVNQGLRLGERTLVGAGAVVVKDFKGDGTLIGVPARAGKRHQ